MRKSRATTFGLFALLLFWATAHFGVSPVEAARISDIRNTKHNLSATGTGTVHASATQTNSNKKYTDSSQVCVFCHTPHGAQLQDAGGKDLAQAPLWNRSVPAGSTYTMYKSSSLDAETLTDGMGSEPGGSSKLCLSCHDGTVAIGNVGAIGGKFGTTGDKLTFDMVGTESDGTMPVGSYNSTSGFTRRLGKDLTNDHPISVTYDSNLAAADGEMRTPDTNQRLNSGNVTGLPAGYTSAVGVRNKPGGERPLLPLEPTSTGSKGQVQCATCHDPHFRDPAVNYNIKFLRANRFQSGTPSASVFDASTDIICLACHDKGGSAWTGSVHAKATLAYNSAAAGIREFPSGIQVWEAACLNCHDTHTVPGSRRLLREGIEGTGVPKLGDSSSKSAIEETCFQCHRPSTDSGQVLSLTSQAVPDIWTDFQYGATTKTYHMPIRSSEQCAKKEVHDIGNPSAVKADRQLKGKDFFEVPDLLGGSGAGSCDSGSNRHVECTDCHNPHRALKNSLYNGGGSTSQATHTHTSGTQHSNLASGALTGTYGVEPATYSGTAFGERPSSFTELCGIEGGANNACPGGVVTKEYQICLKCHSNYAYTDGGAYNDTGRPPLGAANSTATATTGYPYNQWVSGDRYTNQAMEFQAPAGDQSEYGGGGGQTACSNETYDTTCNHRSWHPVMKATGRTGSIRGNNDKNAGDISGNWKAPFNTGVGALTMYCTDCHGNSTAAGTVVPDSGRPWGPHGSTNPFILKGPWNTNTGTGNSSHLCFKCHDYETYTAAGGSGGTTGFWIADRSSNGKGNDGHKHHRDKISGNRMKCNWCHVAVPHGWKNKALLVNLNDVGPEAGETAGTQKNGPYTKGPYYRNAMNKIVHFATSGRWGDQDCGSKGGSTGRSWMQNNCSNPP